MCSSHLNISCTHHHDCINKSMHCLVPKINLKWSYHICVKFHVQCHHSRCVGLTNSWAILRKDVDNDIVLSNSKSLENNTDFHWVGCFIDTDEGILQRSSCREFIHSTYRMHTIIYKSTTYMSAKYGNIILHLCRMGSNKYLDVISSSSNICKSRSM